MLINGNNAVKCIINANTVPTEVTYTQGDIVYYNDVLYSCVNQTTLPPEMESGNWIYYLANLGTASTNSQIEDESINDYLVNVSGLRDFLESRWSGVNSNGTLKLITDTSIELDTLMTNSSYQLSYDYLDNLYNTSSNSTIGLPFLPSVNKVYVIRSTGDLNNGNPESPSIFTQEIIEYTSNGTYRSWVRSGASLTSSTWTPTKGNSFNNEYVNYINKLVNKYNSSRSIYDNFIEDVNNGEYKYWKDLSGDNVNDINNGSYYLQFKSPEDIDQSGNSPDFENLKIDRYYKVYFVTKGVDKVSFSIDITPFDHGISNTEEIFLSGTSIKLDRQTSNNLNTRLVFSTSSFEFRAIKESNKLMP